ncbi:enolase-like domain-containing protein [Natronorubrum daqingense]|uniref:Enolase n=1 Tax=Natronorubrum daqingense TaxID=588898 RepID=A0A1N6YB25_9EURY|nr:enolase [Natronorubrum daqingense]APX95720.1 enolase [Natronorubrum daqingense]SIR11774.1 hypothetical protein SAMN05421809_0383 [Natronorubrum daqingense]
MLYDDVSGLSVDIDGYDLHRHERATSSGFDRVTTTVALHGGDETGTGEDVTYDNEDHNALQNAPEEFSLNGQYTLEEFSTQLSTQELFPGTEPDQSIFRNYRRWAFESAALDLALKQAETTLAERLGREYRPVRFVVSTRLDEPPTGDRILEWLEQDPTLEFKLDPTSEWTDGTVSRLAETDAVRVLDLKGQYHGTTVDQPADPALYERVIDGFPEALIEDPALTDETRPLFEDHEDSVTWDYPIRSVETIEDLPWEPTWLNIKPSRFGSLRALFDTLEYCENNGIRMYGGGQFELGVGREHLHAIASLFYPESPNDIAPKGYNEPEPSDDLPSSPLAPPSSTRGLAWKYADSS